MFVELIAVSFAHLGWTDERPLDPAAIGPSTKSTSQNLFRDFLQDLKEEESQFFLKISYWAVPKIDFTKSKKNITFLLD